MKYQNRRSSVNVFKAINLNYWYYVNDTCNRENDTAETDPLRESPEDLRTTESLDVFEHQLKTYLLLDFWLKQFMRVSCH